MYFSVDAWISPSIGDVGSKLMWSHMLQQTWSISQSFTMCLSVLDINLEPHVSSKSWGCIGDSVTVCCVCLTFTNSHALTAYNRATPVTTSYLTCLEILYLCLIAAVVCGCCQYKWQSYTRWWKHGRHQCFLLWHGRRWCHSNTSACHWWGRTTKPRTAGLTAASHLMLVNGILMNQDWTSFLTSHNKRFSPCMSQIMLRRTAASS